MSETRITHDQEAKPMSEKPQTGTNNILAEGFGVDTGEVDSVGGAKPEPEERPFLAQRILEPNRMMLSDGTIMHAAHDTTVRIESTVEREMIAFGKQCGNCLHFSVELGQSEIARIEVFGEPEDKKMLHSLKAQLEMTGVVDTRGEFVDAKDIFADTGVDKFIKEMGACMAGAAHQGGETQLLHPSQNGCPSKFTDGTVWPWLYVAKSSDVAKRDALIFDNLMKTAQRRTLR